MQILGLIILVLCVLVGFVAIFFTTFGTLIILLGVLPYAYLTQFTVFSIKDLFVLLVVYLLGELLENATIIIGAKKLGASNAAVFGALIGGILGAVIGSLGLGFGVVVGTFLGIFLGAFLVELIKNKNIVRSIKAGAGGVLGRLSSVIAKLVIALIMIFFICVKILFK